MAQGRGGLAGDGLSGAMYQHGDAAIGQHLLGFAAQQNAAQAFSTMRGHADQVALSILGLLDDGFADRCIGYTHSIEGHAFCLGKLLSEMQHRIGFGLGAFSNSVAS